MDFSQGAGQSTGSDLIPNGQLAWVFINVRGVKASTSGGQYIDMELTLDEGQPYGRRKVWEMVGDPLHAANSEGYRQMGQVAIARILECGNNAGPHNPAGYRLDRYEQLSGLRVAVKISVEKGKDGRDDKNRVGEWLTPNPASESGHKGFKMLMDGQVNIKPKPAPASSTGGGFGGGSQSATGTQGFGGGTGGLQQGSGPAGGGGAFAQPPSGGFQQPAGLAQPAQGFGVSAVGHSTATGFAANATSPPSDQPGGWLAQANINR